MRQRRSVVLAALLSFVFWNLGCEFDAIAASEGAFDRVLTVTGAVDLEVATGAGSIRIATGGAGSVRIIGTIRARSVAGRSADDAIRYLETHPPVEQSGNKVRIGKVDQGEYGRNVSISYRIDVPPETRVSANTGSGNIEVSGIRGPVTVRTGSGKLLVERIDSDVRTDTGSGGIVLHAIRGTIQASTGSGSIVATDAGGGLRAVSGSGTVKAELSAPGDVDIETGSGGIQVSGVQGGVRLVTGSGGIRIDGNLTADWKLRAGSGTIEVDVGPEARFELRAHAGSGTIKVEHPITATGVMSRKDVRGAVRGGGPMLEITTHSGNIIVR